MAKIDKYLRSRDFENVEQMRVHERINKEIEANLRRKRRNYTQSIINFMENLTKFILGKLRRSQEEDAFRRLNKHLNFLLEDLLDNFTFHDYYINSSLDLIAKLSRKFSIKEKNTAIKKLYIDRVKNFVIEQKRELRIYPSELRRIRKRIYDDLIKLNPDSEEAKELRTSISKIDNLVAERRIELAQEESIIKESLPNKDIIELAAIRRNLSKNVYKEKFLKNNSCHITRTFYITC